MRNQTKIICARVGCKESYNLVLVYNFPLFLSLSWAMACLSYMLSGHMINGWDWGIG